MKTTEILNLTTDLNNEWGRAEQRLESALVVLNKESVKDDYSIGLVEKQLASLKAAWDVYQA